VIMTILESTKNKRILLWIGAIILLIGGILSLMYSNAITVIMAFIGLIFIILGRFF
jgi:hypothetical protein